MKTNFARIYDTFLKDEDRKNIELSARCILVRKHESWSSSRKSIELRTGCAKYSVSVFAETNRFEQLNPFAIDLFTDKGDQEALSREILTIFMSFNNGWRKAIEEIKISASRPCWHSIRRRRFPGQDHLSHRPPAVRTEKQFTCKMFHPNV